MFGSRELEVPPRRFLKGAVFHRNGAQGHECTTWRLVRAIPQVLS
jgi:hypothetical protein